jgi:hypothetical protein
MHCFGFLVLGWNWSGFFFFPLGRGFSSNPLKSAEPSVWTISKVEGFFRTKNELLRKFKDEKWTFFEIKLSTLDRDQRAKHGMHRLTFFKVKLSTLDRPKSKTWHAPTGISCISTNWHFFIFPLQRDNNRSYIVVSLQPKPLDINKMFGRSFP